MKNSLNENENEDDYIFQNITRSKEDERNKLLEDFLSAFQILENSNQISTFQILFIAWQKYG